jgi:hypothetical protein
MSAKARGTKARTKVKAKARGTKARTKIRNMRKEKGEKGSGKIHAGTVFGVEKGDQTLGKLELGTELGLKKDKEGSGKVQADAKLGLESDSLNEIQEAADDTFENIKSGLKAAKRKLGEHF